jgi:hypothetical protein
MLSIIIVNWNVKDILIKNLESIFLYTKNVDYEVIVVDNNSSDGSVEAVNKAFPDQITNGKLKIIASKKNNGFAKGNNIGYAESKGEYVLFMNPDMELVENSFKILADYLDQHREVGAVGCTLNYPDGSLQKSVKKLPTFFSQVIILLKLHHFLYNLKSIREFLQRDFDYSREQEVEQLMGAFIMMRREVFERAGKWDEDYWIWWEDIELAYELKIQNVKVIYTPRTKIIHHESKSFEQNLGLTRQKRFNKSMLIYFKKHGSKLQYFILILLQPISLFLAWLTQVFRVKMKQQSKV